MDICGALDIGGTKIKIGLVDRQGRVLEETSIPTLKGEDGARRTLECLTEKLQELCGAAGYRVSQLKGIGIVCAGPVDCESGTIRNPYTLSGWENIRLCGELKARTGLPAVLEHDVNGALLGEVKLRGITGKRVLMVCFGTGIGCAVYDYDDRPYRAGHRYHPEMGHILAAQDGPECYCGQKGCFESLWSGSGLNRQAEEGGYAGFDELYEAWRKGEEKAARLIERIEEQFCRGMWNLLVLFKPDIVILGGGMMKRYFSFAEGLLRKLAEGREDFLESFSVLKASDTDPALVGASTLIL